MQLSISHSGSQQFRHRTNKHSRVARGRKGVHRRRPFKNAALFRQKPLETSANKNERKKAATDWESTVSISIAASAIKKSSKQLFIVCPPLPSRARRAPQRAEFTYTFIR